MNKYNVTIWVRSAKTYTVEASDEDDAQTLAEDIFKDDIFGQDELETDEITVYKIN